MAGIYIHIPYCKQACHYCDFHFSTSMGTRVQMINAIKKEISLQKNYLQEEVQTIYFGGGTPSILSTSEVKEILIRINETFTVQKDAEISLEANPDDLSLQKAHELCNAGINRLSIGIQSFVEEDLKMMNRAHDVAMAKNSVKNAREAGFENISIDLMYGLPNLDMATWRSNLLEAIELSAEHISAYCLTIEAGTAFGNRVKKGKLIPPADETTAAQFELMIEMLKNANYEQYEVSNFCKENKYSKHNSSYWTQKPYLGVGPGAHSFNLAKRHMNIAHNTRYIKAIEEGVLPQEEELLSEPALINEYILTRLRTKWGCDVSHLKKLGYDILKDKKEIITLLKTQKLISDDDNLLMLSERGRLLADEITLQLMK